MPADTDSSSSAHNHDISLAMIPPLMLDCSSLCGQDPPVAEEEESGNEASEWERRERGEYLAQRAEEEEGGRGRVRASGRDWLVGGGYFLYLSLSFSSSRASKGG